MTSKINHSGDQTFVVPPGVTSLSVKLWGGGGAGCYGADHPGAGGGYTCGDLVVVPGETLTVVVGQGGQIGAAVTSRESAGASDADYVAGIGRGNALIAGGNGRVVLTYAGGMRLAVPAAVTQNTAPSFANLYFLWKDDSGAAVLGSDISVNLSRDGGTTKTMAALTELASCDGTYSLIRARADVSGQPVGTSLWAEIITTAKLQRVAAPGLSAE